MNRDSESLYGRLFFPYQVHWLEDRSQFKIGLWARQTGKDFTCAAEAVMDCLERKTHWLIVAAGERQALESLQKVRHWGERLQLAAAQHVGATEPFPLQCTESEIRFYNGSRITALPGKPETVRGYSANVILTEFAFHDDPEAIWRAIFPSVSNPLQGGEKKLRVITTPNGQGNFFHGLWHNSKNFSRHRVTIHDARAAGLPIDLTTLKEGILEQDAWLQEYECEFLDGSRVLLPYDLIEACESPEATESSTPQILSTHTGELFAGIDFGRKQDLTVCWILEKLPPNPTLNPNPVFITREVLVLENMSTPAQLEILRPRVARARRTCVDYTGAGVGLGDLLFEEFGSTFTGAKYSHRLASNSTSSPGKIELCQFTPALKQELFPTLRAAFERGRVQIPKSSTIREDLHGIHKYVSGHGQISYRAAHTSDGHSDRCTALALALRAAEGSPPGACATSVAVGRR